MNKALAITAALVFTAGGTLWAAMALPSAPESKTPGNTLVSREAPSTSRPNAETLGGRRGGHVCGYRFCGWHEHHHGHVWCDGHNHWYCGGHD